MDWAGLYKTLVDNEPPSTTTLQAEGSGCGLLSVYIEQTVAEYTPLISSDADDTFLRGLEDNLLKITSDYYLAQKLTMYLGCDGSLDAAEGASLNADLKHVGETKITFRIYHEKSRKYHTPQK